MQKQWGTLLQAQQGLSSHNGEGDPCESSESFLYCIAGEVGREA